MSMDRIPKVVYKWNKEFADMNNLKSWSHQVKQMVSPIDKDTLNFGSFKL